MYASGGVPFGQSRRIRIFIGQRDENTVVPSTELYSPWLAGHGGEE